MRRRVKEGSHVVLSGGLEGRGSWKATARFAEMEHAVWSASAVVDGATTPFPPHTHDSSVSVSLDHGLAWGGGEASL